MIEVKKGNVKKNIGVGDLVELQGLDWNNTAVGVVVETPNGVNVVVFDDNFDDDEEVYLNYSSCRKTLEEINNDEEYRLLAKSKDYKIKFTY